MTDYICSICKNSNIRLWNEVDFSLEDVYNCRLICRSCIPEIMPPRHYYFPGYLSEDGTFFYPVASVPDSIKEWWNNLPIKRNELD